MKLVMEVMQWHSCIHYTVVEDESGGVQSSLSTPRAKSTQSTKGEKNFPSTVLENGGCFDEHETVIGYKVLLQLQEWPLPESRKNGEMK